MGQALAVGLIGGALWGGLEALFLQLGGLGGLWDHFGQAPPGSPVDWASATLQGALCYACVGALVLPPATLALGWLVARGKDAPLAPGRALVVLVVGLHLFWATKPMWAFTWGLPFHHPARLAMVALWLGVGAGVARLAVQAPDRRPVSGLAALAVLGLLLLPALAGVELPGWLAALHLAALWAAALLALWPAWLCPAPRMAVGVTLAVLTLGGGWASLREARLVSFEGRPSPPGRPPSVLLVVVDALRADRLGCYGHTGRTPPVSPHVDALAAEGVLFERAVTQAPFTWTSFGSLLTGKYPRRHGLLKMLPNQRLDPKRNRTLPQALQEAGYVTGAFLTGTLSNNSGLLQGFDTYFETIVGHEPVNRDSSWSILRADMLLMRLYNKVRQKFDVRLVNTEALDWIERHAARPFFALVHYYSTHTPYAPPEPWGRVYDPAYEGPFQVFTQSHGHAVLAGDLDFGPRDLQHVRALYDGGVAFADEMFGALLAKLAELGLADDTLVIFTSDHGEELYDHGVFEHDWMFNTNLLVPLVMRLPGGARAGTSVPWPVEMIDIPATVLAVTKFGSLRDIDGRSLLPDAAGTEPAPGQKWAFSENNRYLAAQDEHLKIIRNHRDRSRPPRVFDLGADPSERLPLADPDLTASLGHRLDAFEAAMPRFADVQGPWEEDPVLARRLASLGYLGPNRMLEEDLPAAAPESEER